MKRVDAVAHLDAQGAPLAIHLLSAVDGAPLAVELVRGALKTLSGQRGVVRLHVDGPASAPTISFENVAGPRQHFYCATVERQDVAAVRISSVFESPAPGLPAPSAARVQSMLTEAAAAASAGLPISSQAHVDLVLDA